MTAANQHDVYFPSKLDSTYLRIHLFFTTFYKQTLRNIILFCLFHVKLTIHLKKGVDLLSTTREELQRRAIRIIQFLESKKALFYNFDSAE